MTWSNSLPLNRGQDRTGATKSRPHSRPNESEVCVTQHNMHPLHSKPRDLLAQPRVTQYMPYSGSEKSSDCATQSNPHPLPHSSWDIPSRATTSNPGHDTLWATGEHYWSELEKSGMPSQGPQYHVASALPEGLRVPLCHGCWGHTENCMSEGSGSSQGVAQQRN